MRRLLFSLLVALASVQAPAKPTPVNKVAPAYPESAEQQGHYGPVTVRVSISATGPVASATVARSSRSPLLDAAAIEAAKQWTFAPIVEQGSSESEFTIAFDFKRPERFEDSRRLCKDLVAEVEWLTKAFPEVPIQSRPIYYQTFRAYVRTPYESKEREQFLLSLSPKFEELLTRCRQIPDTKAQEVTPEVVRNEPYYKPPMTKEEVQQTIKRINELQTRPHVPQRPASASSGGG